ncbi:hypothetical protein MBLNU230_g7595t1 [Neophaeotheca triangularis]
MALAPLPTPSIPTPLLLLLESPGPNFAALNSALRNPDLAPLTLEEALKHALNLLTLTMGDGYDFERHPAAALELELAFPGLMEGVVEFMEELQGKDLVPERLGVEGEGGRWRAGRGRGGWVCGMSGPQRVAEVRVAVVRAVRFRERLRRGLAGERERRGRELRRERAGVALAVEELGGWLGRAVWEEKRRGVEERVRRALLEREEGERKRGMAGGGEGSGVEEVGDGHAAAVVKKGEESKGRLVEDGQGCAQCELENKEGGIRSGHVCEHGKEEGNMKILAIKLKLREKEQELAAIEKRMEEGGFEL